MDRLAAEPGARRRVEGHQRVERQVGRRDREAAILADDEELQRTRRPVRLHFYLDDPIEARLVLVGPGGSRLVHLPPVLAAEGATRDDDVEDRSRRAAQLQVGAVGDRVDRRRERWYRHLARELEGVPPRSVELADLERLGGDRRGTRVVGVAEPVAISLAADGDDARRPGIED